MIRIRLSTSGRLAVGCVFFIACCRVAVGQEKHSAEESYFPLAVGNSWDYSVRGHSQFARSGIRWQVTQKEVVHGTPVFHLWETPSQSDEPLSLAMVPDGVKEADTDRFLVKNAMQPGDRWVAASQSLRAKLKGDSFEVASAGAACTVGGRSFVDCLVIKEVDEANNLGSVTTYARGIGPVKYVYFRGLDFKVVDTVLTITAWKVP